MTRCLHSFFYTMLHDIVFYILISVVVILSLSFSAKYRTYFQNHQTQNTEAGKIRVCFEEEDPSIIVRNSSGSSSYYRGKIIYGEYSKQNSFSVSNYTIIAMFIIMLASLVYQSVFCGRLFSDGVIRNLVISGISKVRVFLSAFVMSLIFLCLFTLTFVLTAIPANLCFGNYLIIYWPSYLPTLLCVALILIFTSAFALFVLFLSHNAMLTLILTASFAIFFSVAAPEMVFGAIMDDGVAPYATKMVGVTVDMEKYGNDPYLASNLDDPDRVLCVGSDTYPIEKESYCNTYNYGLTVYVDGKEIDVLDYNRPNRLYKGTAYHVFWNGCLHGNPYSFALLSAMYEYHALVRDGFILEECLVSSAYTVILLVGGCIMTKKRNIT